MRKINSGLVALFLFGILALVPLSVHAQTYTLTVIVEGINQKGGNVGMLVFNSDKGWPDDRGAALKDISIPVKPGGTMTIPVPDLPAGDYAVAAIHDVNVNHKLDKNFMGVPTEQWGMSNNPSHVGLKAPAFTTAKFSLKGDMEIHIKLQ